jgi:hypothetical protein
VRTGGELEIFFDDTQLEVTGKAIEGAALNDAGQRALGWQALFVGPLLARPNRHRRPHAREHTHLGDFIAAHAALGGRDAALLLRRLRLQRGETPRLGPRRVSPLVALLQPLDRTARTRRRSAARQVPGPPCRRTAITPTCSTSPRAAPSRKSTPCAAGAARASCSPATRFCACEGGSRAPRAVWDRHDLKGERERMFAQLQSDLDLHHPSCLAMAANLAF